MRQDNHETGNNSKLSYCSICGRPVGTQAAICLHCRTPQMPGNMQDATDREAGRDALAASTFQSATKDGQRNEKDDPSVSVPWSDDDFARISATAAPTKPQARPTEEATRRPAPRESVLKTETSSTDQQPTAESSHTAPPSSTIRHRLPHRKTPRVLPDEATRAPSPREPVLKTETSSAGQQHVAENRRAASSPSAAPHRVSDRKVPRAPSAEPVLKTETSSIDQQRIEEKPQVASPSSATPHRTPDRKASRVPPASKLYADRIVRARDVENPPFFRPARWALAAAVVLAISPLVVGQQQLPGLQSGADDLMHTLNTYLDPQSPVSSKPDKIAAQRLDDNGSGPVPLSSGDPSTASALQPAAGHDATENPSVAARTETARLPAPDLPEGTSSRVEADNEKTRDTRPQTRPERKQTEHATASIDNNATVIANANTSVPAVTNGTAAPASSTTLSNPAGATERLSPASGLVSEVQARLAILGYAPGPIDGAMHSQTRDAIRAFQVDAGLETTGEIDGAFVARLRQTQRVQWNFSG